MAVRYQLLGDAQADHIRRQRLLDLEADHFRFVLDVEELPDGVDPAPIMEKIADVERRIEMHRQALGLPEVVTTPEGADEVTPEHSGAK
jgi:hypothetical protein